MKGSGRVGSRRSAALLAAMLFSLTGCGAIHRGQPGSNGSQDSSSFDTFKRAEFEAEQDRATARMTEVPQSSEAYYQFLKGELSFREEKYDEALAAYEKAANLEKGPAGTLRLRLAQLYVRNNQLEKALEQVKIGLESEPEHQQLLEFGAGILASLSRYREAIALYERLISLQPQPSEESVILLATLYAQEGQYDMAKHTVEELLERDNKSAIGHYFYGRLCDALKDYACAEAQFRETLRLYAGAEHVRLDLAKVLWKDNRKDEAIAIIKDVLRVNPQNKAAHDLLGQFHVMQGEYQGALKEFEEVVRLAPDPEEARLKISLLKLYQKDYEGAAEQLVLLRAAHPDRSDVRYYLASAYGGAGRLDEAIQEIRGIQPKQEYFSESRTLGAFLLRQQQRPKEAAALMEELRAESDDINVVAFLMTLYREAGDKQKTVELGRELVKRHPDSDEYHFSLGVAYDELGQEDQAFKEMQEAIRLNPKNHQALNYVGYSLADKGQSLDEAVGFIRRALAEEPDNGYYLDSLAWALYRQGHFSEAEEYMNKAVQKVSDDAVILEHLALIQIKVGKPQEAKRTAQTALQFARESDDKAVGDRLKALIQKLNE